MTTENVHLTTLLRPLESAKTPGFIRIAAHFSFVLEGGSTLAQFPLLSHWPTAAAQFEFMVAADNKPLIMAQVDTSSLSLDPATGLTLWSGLFPPSTPVTVRDQQQERNRLINNRPLTYDAPAFHQEALNRYQASVHSAFSSKPPAIAPAASRRAITTTHIQDARSFFSLGKKPMVSAAAPLDFDAIVGALHEYPSLLRALGLVFELRFPVTGSAFFERISISIPGLNGLNGVKPVWIGAIDSGGWDTTYVRGSRIKPLTLDVAHAASSMAAAASDAPFALRTSGISLVCAESDLTNPADALLRKVKAADDILSKLKVNSAHVHAGYRVDVQEFHPKTGIPRTLSLCRRSGTLTIGGQPEAPQHTLPAEDEGFVSCSVAREGDAEKPITRLNSTIARWLGWSLCVKRPGMPVPHYENATPLGNIIHEDVRALALPSLRFGNDYCFALRPVDITGYSAPLPEATVSPSQDELSERVRYLRFEPIKPPVFVPCADFGPAESLLRMVVPPAGGVSQRWVVPPDTTFEMAERHGVFDAQPGSLNPSALEAALLRDGQSLWQSQISETTESKAKINKAQQVPANNTGGLRIPHLPDPVARNAVFLNTDSVSVFPSWPKDPICDPIPFEVGTTSSSSEPGGGLHYPDSFKAFLLELRGVPTGQDSFVKWDANSRVLTFGVPQGRTTTLQVGSAPGVTDFYNLGASHTSFIEGSSKTSIAPDDPMWQKLAIQGQLLGVSPGINLTLVNPIRRQSAPPVLRITSTIRGALETAVHFTGSIEADRFATDHVVITCLPSGATSAGASNSAPSHVGTVRADANGFFNFNSLRLDFHDTRSRDVMLTATAVGAYREYFSDQDGSAFSISGTPVPVNIPASAPPAAPKLAHSLPIFKDSELAGGSPGSVVFTHSGNGLRLYLKTPFDTSGPQEQLAVIVRLANQTADSGTFTIYGADPLAGGTLPATLSATSFAASASVPWEESTGSASTALAAQLFPIQYEQELNRSFCDILFSPEWESAYGPFVQLAVAVYQQHAVPGCHFSKIVASQFAQLPPTRQITITTSVLNLPATDPDKYQVNAKLVVQGAVPDYKSQSIPFLLDAAHGPLQTTLIAHLRPESEGALTQELVLLRESSFEPDAVMKAVLRVPPTQQNSAIDALVPGVFKGSVATGIPSLASALILELTEVEIQNSWSFDETLDQYPGAVLAIPQIHGRLVQNVFRVIWHRQIRLVMPHPNSITQVYPDKPVIKDASGKLQVNEQNLPKGLSGKLP